jgi:hypothetical protein
MSFFNKKGWFTAAMAGTLVLAACSDDPTGLDEHSEPEGVVLTLSGATIATYDGDTGMWTGELNVTVGTETAHIDVDFVDHDGHPIPIDADLYLEVVIADPTIADFEQDTPGEFGGHLHGDLVGMTTAVFQLMHGTVGSGHADFVTAPVTVNVNAVP